MNPPWRLLGSIPQSPPLLIRYEFEPSQYKIHLTDLTYFWTETLERRQIFKRALNIDTSIDPSEGTDQLRLLLRKIQISLEGAEGTKLSLSRGDNLDELILHTTAELPSPFKSLHWPIYLGPAARDSLTTELLLPCLSQQVVAKAQVESLLQLLKEKDHVISKLSDRMQSDGVDFGALFPGALGSRIGTKISDREYAGKLVKGLGAFDENQWRRNLSMTLSSLVNLQDILPRVFVPDPTETLKIDRGTGHGDWLRQLKGNDPQDFSSAVISHQTKPLQDLTTRQSDKLFDEDFQKQNIPSRMKTPNPERESKPAVGLTGSSKHKKHTVDSDHGSTTAEEINGDAKRRKPRGHLRRGSSPEPPSPKVDYRLSPKFIQNSRQEDQGESESPTSPLPRGISRALKPTAAENGPSLPAETPKAIEAVQKPRGKLGKIGGKVKREKESELNEHPVSAVPAVPDDSSSSAPKDRGRKEVTQTLANTIGSTTVSQPPVRPKSPIAPRESSQERANNKREELKRQLESKSNANVKKKRKF